MAHYQVTKLSSKFEVIEVLQSLLGHEQWSGVSDQLQAEWKIISLRLSDVLLGQGKEGWDFALMDWPADVPLFNVSINRATLSAVISIDDLVELLVPLELPWCIRIECLDRIQDNLMVGGDDLRDAVVTKGIVYLWEADAVTKIP